MSRVQVTPFQKKLIIWLLVAFGLFIALVGYQRVHGINMLRAMLYDLAQQGEEMDYRKLAATQVSESNNAVPILLTLQDRLDGIHGLLRSGPTYGELSTEGRVRPVLSLEEWEYRGIDPDTDERITRTNNWLNFSTDLAPQTNLLETVLKALSRPGYYTGYNLDEGFHNLPMDANMLGGSVRNLLVAGFMYHARAGDLRSAHRCLVGLQRMSSGLASDELIIGQLLRQAVVAISFGVTWQALQLDGWRDEELAVWSGHWSDWDIAGDMLKATRMERALQYEMIRRLGGKAGTAEQRRIEWEANWDMGHGWDRTVNERLVVPMWHFIWQERDCCRSLDGWAGTVGLQKLAIAEGWSSAIDQFTGKSGGKIPDWAAPMDTDLNWFDSHRYLFSSYASHELEPWVKKTQGCEALRRLAVTAIALHRYRMRHARVPTKLVELVPELLPAVPVDPMDLHPLRYRVEDGRWILYSVGYNGVDDGGSFSHGDGKEVYSVRDGADIVWPEASEE